MFDASTFSQNRRRRFDGTALAQQIFDRIVEEALNAGLWWGARFSMTCSTHLKALANRGRHDPVWHGTDREVPRGLSG